MKTNNAINVDIFTQSKPKQKFCCHHCEIKIFKRNVCCENVIYLYITYYMIMCMNKKG